MGLVGSLLFSLSVSAFAALECVYPLVRYSDGLMVRHERRWFGLSDRVRVTYPNGEEVSFNRTNRGVARVRQELLYPDRLLALSPLKGKRVLDIGCGGGAFVADLRAAGVDAFGSDLLLTPAQRRKPHLVQAQTHSLPFASESFDVVYSTWSFLAYEGAHTDAASEQRVVDFLREIARITKPGGSIRLSPVPQPQIEKALARLPTLRLVGEADASWLARSYYVETVSIRDTPIRMSASAWVEIEKQPEPGE